MKKLAVIIGRFQPFHNSHKALVDFAFTKAENVMLFLGSSGADLTLKNPFSNDERTQMIRKTFAAELRLNTILTHGMPDHIEDRIWVAKIEKLAKEMAHDLDVVLVGCKKDESSFYLDLFPYWDKALFEHDEKVSGTSVRHLFFNKHIGLDDIAPHVPNGTLQVLEELWNSKRRAKFMREYADIEREILKGLGKF